MPRRSDGTVSYIGSDRSPRGDSGNESLALLLHLLEPPKWLSWRIPSSFQRASRVVGTFGLFCVGALGRSLQGAEVNPPDLPGVNDFLRRAAVFFLARRVASRREGRGVSQTVRTRVKGFFEPFFPPPSSPSLSGRSLAAGGGPYASPAVGQRRNRRPPSFFLSPLPPATIAPRNRRTGARFPHPQARLRWDVPRARRVAAGGQRGGGSSRRRRSSTVSRRRARRWVPPSTRISAARGRVL